MKIALIRHFRTKGNVEKRYIGTTDEHIEPMGELRNPSGYPEAEVVIASPLLRCVETAQLIYGVEPLRSDSLRECDFGRFENHNFEELKEDEDYLSWIKSKGKMAFPNGESAEIFRRRCTKGFVNAIDLLLEQNVETAAFVVHGGTIMAIMERFGIPQKAFYERQVSNGSGYLVSIENENWQKGKRQVKEEAVL